MKWRAWSVTCDVCGFEYDADEVMHRWDGAIVCAKDFEHRHPLDLIRPGRTQRPLPFTRQNKDGTLWVTYDNFRLRSTETTDTAYAVLDNIPLYVAYDYFTPLGYEYNGEEYAQISVTEQTDVGTIFVESNEKNVSFAVTESTDSTNNSFVVTSPLALVTPTPTGSITGINSGYGYGVVRLYCLNDGYIYKTKMNSSGTMVSDGTVGYVQSPGGTNGTGKYWRWISGSGSPNTTNMLDSTYYPATSGASIGYEKYGVGTSSITITLQFADDASGTNATTAGTWTLTVTVN